MQACYEISTGNILYTVQDDAVPFESEDRAFVYISKGDAQILSGRKVVDGVIVLVSLASQKANAIASLHNAVATARREFVTDLPGQEMIYLDKLTEARAYLTDPAPNLADYPAIVAELGVTAETPYELAQLWLNMSAMWKFVSANIESIRLMAVNAINVAASEAEINAILSAAESDLEGFV